MSWKDVKKRKKETGKGLWAQATEDYEMAKAKRLCDLVNWAEDYDGRRAKKKEKRKKKREARRENKRKVKAQREWLKRLEREHSSRK